MKEPLNKLQRSTSCAPAVLGILMYLARTLRFLRSGDAQPVFARDACSRLLEHFPEQTLQ
ncbi:MAG: hypothetical protein JSR27_11555 [Proteobacteria bacterium]|nr:hypothetical protein [Pseudomonadota bacterium]